MLDAFITALVHHLRDTSERIGSSSTCRDVYDLGDAVLKIDRDGGRWSDTTYGYCAHEIAVWDRVKNTDDAAHFAAILAADPDGTWLVMEKIPVTHSALDQTVKLPLDTRETMRKHEVRDLHNENWGNRADGTAAVFDYGHNGPIPY